MFSRYGKGRISGGVSSGKMFSPESIVFNQTSEYGDYIPGSGVGATSVFARRAKSIRATPILPLAPKIVGIVKITNTTITLNVIQRLNGSSPVINYKYSIDGGFSFMSFSPANRVSPVKIRGLTLNTLYSIVLIAVNGHGESLRSNLINVRTLNAPLPPEINTSSITNTNTTITVEYTQTPNGTPPITGYKYSIDDGNTFNYLSTTDATSPLTIGGLQSGTTYKFQLIAINESGDSEISDTNAKSIATKMTPLAPTNLSVVYKGVNTVTIAFTQPVNEAQKATGYKYSIDGGNTFNDVISKTALSPITVYDLTNNTTYSIILKAVNSIGDSEPSSSITETTYNTVSYATFTTVGNATWTAPAGVTEIEYLVVGGGGGGGATYSQIEYITNYNSNGSKVAINASTTINDNSLNDFWINRNATGVDEIYRTGQVISSTKIQGRLYKYKSEYTTYTPAVLNLNSGLTGGGGITNNWFNQWYRYTDASYVCWNIVKGIPMITNLKYMDLYSVLYAKIYTNVSHTAQSGLYSGQQTAFNIYMFSRDSNNISAGSGGGGGGSILSSAIYPYPKYKVVPGKTYEIYVGDGGAGGIGGTNSETAGSDGSYSRFDTLIASGGIGGKPSREGFDKDGGGGQNINLTEVVPYSSRSYYSTIIGGRGGSSGDRNNLNIKNSSEPYYIPKPKDIIIPYNINSNSSAIISGYAPAQSPHIVRGSYGGSGEYIDFKYEKTFSLYGNGGDGGYPLKGFDPIQKTENIYTAPENTGEGGRGTAATRNSYNSGNKGSSGVVIIRYYT